MDIIKLSNESADLYDELISMANNNDYDFEEIETINSEIDDIERKVLRHRRKTSKLLKRLYPPEAVKQFENKMRMR